MFDLNRAKNDLISIRDAKGKLDIKISQILHCIAENLSEYKKGDIVNVKCLDEDIMIRMQIVSSTYNEQDGLLYCANHIDENDEVIQTMGHFSIASPDNDIGYKYFGFKIVKE